MNHQAVVRRGKHPARVGTVSKRPRQRLSESAADALKGVTVAVLLAIVGDALYWKPASAGIWFVVLSITGICFLATNKARMRAIDVCAVLILVSEFASLALSQYAANGIFALRSLAVAVAVFFTARLTMRTPLQVACLSGVLGLGGALISLPAMRQFAANAGRLRALGLNDLVAFRSNLITPSAPWVAGEWFTAILLTLPFAFAFAAHFWVIRKSGAVACAIPPALILVTLTLSLSRAVFWSTVAFLFFACALIVLYRVVTVRNGMVLFAFVLGAFVLILVIESAFFRNLSKAYMGQQLSEARSTAGRVVTWRRSLEVVRAHPLWGVGPSNAPVALLSSTDENETTGFASRTFSLPVQVLVEKGIVGLALYGTLLILMAGEFLSGMADRWRGVAQGGAADFKADAAQTLPELPGVSGANRRARDSMSCCFAAGLVVVLARELMYSSIFEHTVTLVLVASWLPFLFAPIRAN